MFEEFKDRNSRDVLATGSFDTAKLLRSGNSFRMEYVAKDLSSIEHYFETFAMPLRKDFLDHFPRGVELSRRVWELRASFENPKR